MISQPIFVAWLLSGVLCTPIPDTQWESVHVSLGLIPEPHLIRPVPLLAHSNVRGVRELTIQQGDIVGLRFSIYNNSDQPTLPMVVDSHPNFAPLAVVIVHPDGSRHRLGEFDPRRRRLPSRERPMEPHEIQVVNFFVYHVPNNASPIDLLAYAFPQTGEYQIYALYEAASAHQKAQALRDGTPHEDLYTGMGDWETVVAARRNIPIPPMFRTEAVTVKVEAPFDQWHQLKAEGIRMQPGREPWHEKIDDPQKRTAIEQLVAAANRLWLTQWWEGIADAWSPLDARKDQSLVYMGRINISIIIYAIDHEEKLPDSLDQLKLYFNDEMYNRIMTNPVTGENPGYIYIKPAGNLNDTKHNPPMLYEVKDGQPDPDGAVGYADGRVVRP